VSGEALLQVALEGVLLEREVRADLAAAQPLKGIDLQRVELAADVGELVGAELSGDRLMAAETT
jgi:hypothetical protein